MHAIVGPSSSANSLLVIERVSAPASPPLAPRPRRRCSPPRRTATSSSAPPYPTAQGPVLADLGSAASATWGSSTATMPGLADAFRPPGTATFVSRPWSPAPTRICLSCRGRRRAGAHPCHLQHGGGHHHTRGLAARSVRSVRARRRPLARGDPGRHRRSAAQGDVRAATAAPGSSSTLAWQEAYVAEYGALPQFAYTMESYDAAIVIAMAAQAAGSVDGAAIRDRLRAVGGEGGVVVIAGAGVAGPSNACARAARSTSKAPYARLGRERRPRPRAHRRVAVHPRRWRRKARRRPLRLTGSHTPVRSP